MRKIVLWVLTACLWSAGGTAGEVVRAAYEDKSLPPYYVGGSDAIDPVAPGVSVEMLREAAKEAGVDIQFVRMPWVRCLKALQRGEVDLIFNSSFKEDRLEAGVYPMASGKADASRRIATISYVFYRVKGSKVAFTDGKLSGVAGPVGVSQGYSVIEDLTKAGIRAEEAPDTLTNFKKLASGRIEAVAAQDVQGDALLIDFPTIEKVLPPLVSKDYFVMASHQYYDVHRDTVERLWAKLAEVRNTKGYAIYAKYMR